MASTSKRARLAFVALLAMPAAVISLTNGIARAHAIVVAAHPAVDSTVAPGELQIRLDFNSRVDRRRSRLSLRQPDGTELVVALEPEGPPGVLAGRAQVRQTGRWTLHWQALSLDGHLTRGEVSFSVRGVVPAP